MPEVVMILWLPVTIACMAVAYVCALSAISGREILAEKRAVDSAHGER